MLLCLGILLAIQFKKTALTDGRLTVQFPESEEILFQIQFSFATGN